MKPAFMTALGDRISSPSVVNTHARPNENATTSSIAATTPGTPPSGRKPSTTPSTTTRWPPPGSARCRPHGAHERRGPPDRQGAEAVDDAPGHVRVQRDAGVDRREEHRHDQDAGQDELQVRARRPGDRPAEHVREHQREQHRRHRHVDQLLGNVLDLQHRPPAERQRGGEEAGARRPRLEESALRSATSALVSGRCGCVRRCSCGLLIPSSAGVAGQREEHLVQARLPEREVGDARRRRATAPRRPAPPGRRPRTRPTAPPGRPRGGRRRARAPARARPRAAGRDRAGARAARPSRRTPSAGPACPPR